MPIRLPVNLPAHAALEREGVMVMTHAAAERQDIRPLQIGLLNLMPLKAQTETQFARLIGATPLQIELTLIRMSRHESRHTPQEHLRAFYQPFEEARARKFDGLIVTGAPVEHLAFDEVTYMDELRQVFDWTQTNVHHSLGVCWGGMAMLNHFHGIAKHMLAEKMFGCFRHRVAAPSNPFLVGISDDLVMPVSRWTEVTADDLAAAGLEVLVGSDEAGPAVVDDPAHRALYIFNHLEYDSDTLRAEYDRDVAAGGEIRLPVNYFPGDDPALAPQNRWRSHAHLFYGNWINRIYQSSPFDPSGIGG